MFSIIMSLYIVLFHHRYRSLAYHTDKFHFKLHKKLTYSPLYLKFLFHIQSFFSWALFRQMLLQILCEYRFLTQKLKLFMHLLTSATLTCMQHNIFPIQFLSLIGYVQYSEFYLLRNSDSLRTILFVIIDMPNEAWCRRESHSKSHQIIFQVMMECYRASSITAQ